MYRRLLELVTTRTCGSVWANEPPARLGSGTTGRRIIPRYEALFTHLLDAVDGDLPDAGCLRGPLTYDVQRIFAPLSARRAAHRWYGSACRRAARRGYRRRFPLSTQRDFPIDDTDVRDVLHAVTDAATPRSVQGLIDT